MATLRGETVDRPAVSFYEIGGFKIDVDDPDPYNVYNSPDWRPLVRLAEEKTDLIRLMSPVRPRSIDPTWGVAGSARDEFFTEEIIEEEDCRITRTTVIVAGRTLTQAKKRTKDLDTVWTTEHLLKDLDDVKAYLKIPDDVFAENIDITPLEEEEAKLGDRGIVMVDTEDSLCEAAMLFSMEDYTIFAMTEQKLFHQLLEKFARLIQARTETVSRLFPGHYR